MNTTTQSNPTNAKHTSRKAKLGYILLTLLLISAAAYGVYVWQHSKLTSTVSDLNISSEKVTFLTQQQKALSDQVSVLNDKNNAMANTPGSFGRSNNAQMTALPVAPEFKVEASDARKYTSDSTYQAVAVDVVVANQSDTTMSLALGEFELTDNVNNKSFNYGTDAGKTLANGSVVLSAGEILPGESLKGTMVFNTLGNPKDSYTLTYKSQTFQLTVR